MTPSYLFGPAALQTQGRFPWTPYSVGNPSSTLCHEGGQKRDNPILNVICSNQSATITHKMVSFVQTIPAVAVKMSVIPAPGDTRCTDIRASRYCVTIER